MEMYALNVATLGKFLRVACRVSDSTNGILKWLTPLLRQVVAIHDVLDASGWGATPVELAKYLSYDAADKILSINRDGYVGACLQRAKRLKERERFMGLVAKRVAAAGDHRLHIRGHTFTEILGGFLRGRLGIDGTSARLLAGTVVGSIEREALTKDALFSQVLARVA